MRPPLGRDDCDAQRHRALARSKAATAQRSHEAFGDDGTIKVMETMCGGETKPRRVVALYRLYPNSAPHMKDAEGGRTTGNELPQDNQGGLSVHQITRARSHDGRRSRRSAQRGCASIVGGEMVRGLNERSAFASGRLSNMRGRRRQENLMAISNREFFSAQARTDRATYRHLGTCASVLLSRSFICLACTSRELPTLPLRGKTRASDV